MAVSLRRAALCALLVLTFGVAARAADPQRALVDAAREADIEGVISALAAGGDPDGRDARGWTPLLHAALRGHPGLVAVLLASDADPDAADPQGATPLMAAAVGGHMEVVRALVEAGADPLRRNSAGATARAKAEEYGHVAVAGYLSALERLSTRPATLAPEAPAADTLPARHRLFKGANLRAGPDPETEKLGALAEGTVVTVVARVPGRRWYEIAWAGRAAYVFDTVLGERVGDAPASAHPAPMRPPDEEPPDETLPQPGAAERETREPDVSSRPAPDPIASLGAEHVLVKGANLRAGPSSDALLLGSLPEGTRVLVTGRSPGSNWYRVGTGPHAAWLFGTTLERVEPGLEAPIRPATSPDPEAVPDVAAAPDSASVAPPEPRPEPAARAPAEPTLSPPPALARGLAVEALAGRWTLTADVGCRAGALEIAPLEGGLSLTAHVAGEPVPLLEGAPVEATGPRELRTVDPADRRVFRLEGDTLHYAYRDTEPVRYTRCEARAAP